jgi:hypothetical protein
MLDRAACERRVYRLATLLTGKPTAAARVIDQVLAAQPDLRALDGAHMDRLTVLRSREIPAGRIVDDALPASSAEALAALTAQQREAWIFRRLYALPPREAARAMDCSVTALGLHLDQAQWALGPDDRELARELLAYTMTLDTPAFYRARRARRRRWRRVLLAAAVLAAAVALALLLRWGFSGP